MSINYNYFFQLELLHAYFADGACNDFTVTPSALTQAALRGNKMIVKQFGNKLYTGLQTDDAGKAFLTPSSDLQLTFFLQLNNPVFFNYTNLPFTYLPGKVYYFTNRNNNVSNNKNYISQPAIYSNTKNYHPGDIATDGGGVVFQCISSCTNVLPSTANSANWMKIDNSKYVSEADALQWIPSVSTGTFSAAQSNAVIDVWAYNLIDKKFSVHVLSQTMVFAHSTKSFTLDLSKLSPGKYKLVINNVTRWIYINDELSAKPVFAVIEIFNDGSLASTYKLLNGSALKSPLYTINFLNRSTIWKYILNASSKGNISMTGFSFPSTAANVILSDSPIPLRETPLDVSLTLSTVNNLPVTPAISISDVACPSPQKLNNFTKGTDKYACSEIFLNH